MASTKTKAETAQRVTVGLKSPNGLILRLFRKESMRENTPSGPRTVEQFVPNLEAGTVELKGYKGAAFGQRQDHRIVGQYALTENVDAEFMREWLKQNQEHDLVKNNLIFIHESVEDAAAQGTEQKGVWDGLNPLRMHGTKNDPRVSKRIKTATQKDDDDGEQAAA